MEKQDEVIIIGGRIPGSSLAIRLGRQNIRVLLIDGPPFQVGRVFQAVHLFIRARCVYSMS
jgi:flavin-dependent dehydrogenase